MPHLCSQSKDDFTKVPAWVHLEEAEFVLCELMLFFFSVVISNIWQECIGSVPSESWFSWKGRMWLNSLKLFCGLLSGYSIPGVGFFCSLSCRIAQVLFLIVSVYFVKDLLIIEYIFIFQLEN